MIFKLLFILLILSVPSSAAAYIGPGAGISVLGSLLAVLGTIALAIGAILFWPIRKLLKRRKGKQAGDTPDSSTESADG
jgi:hypothetical protein